MGWETWIFNEIQLIRQLALKGIVVNQNIL